MRKAPLAFFSLLTVLSLRCMADTVTLKDGTVIDGRITQENDTQVTVTIQVSAGITDERVLKREEIAKIEKTSKEDLDFAQLQNLNPDPLAMFTADAYKTAIASLKSYLAKYPDTAHKADVQAKIDALEDELKRQAAGEVKLYGAWITKKEAADRALQIKGQGLYLKMKSLASQGDVIGALNTFDDIEKTALTTRAYPLAIEYVKPIELSLQVQVNRSTEDLKQQDDKWAKDIEVTPEPARSQTIAARKAEIASFDAQVADATKNGFRWPPFLPQSKTSLDALSTLLSTERPHLASLQVDQMNQSLAISVKALAAMKESDLDNADSLSKDAIKLWKQNEEAVYVQKSVAATKAALAHPSVTPTPEPTKPPHPPAKPVAVATPPPAGSASPAASSKAAKQDDEGGSWTDFFFTIKGAITVVLSAAALLGILTAVQKMRKPQDSGEDDGEGEA